MLRHILAFEGRLLLRNGVFWIVLAVFGLIGFTAMASENVSFGGGVGNILRNAPAVVIALLGGFSVLSVLLSTIFVAGIALRDFEQRTGELFFSTPLRRRDYLLGRFGVLRRADLYEGDHAHTVVRRALHAIDTLFR